MHSIEELQQSTKYLIRKEENIDNAKQVLLLADGEKDDVVGMNDTIRIYSCFRKDGALMYVDYDAIITSHGLVLT